LLSPGMGEGFGEQPMPGLSNGLRALSGEDAIARTHCVIVDCVGITETKLAETQPLERKGTVSLKALLEHGATGRKWGSEGSS